MSSAISPLSTSTGSSGKSTALNGMNASDFLNLMIKQLQQQDPLNPTDSNQLLTQMSQIGSLQSNTQLQQTLTQMGLQQSIGASGNLIGKVVNGIDGTGTAVQGTVTSVRVANQKVNLELDTGKELPMTNVTAVAATANSGIANLTNGASGLPDLATLLQSNPQLQTLLNSSGGSNLSNLSSLANLLSALGGK